MLAVSFSRVLAHLLRLLTSADRASLAEAAELVVCQGLEVAEPALLAGRRVLMLPVFVEQTMTVRRVVAQGLGAGLPPDADGATIEAALRRLAGDDACRRRVENLRRHYEGYRPGIAVSALADAIEDLLQGEAGA